MPGRGREAVAAPLFADLPAATTDVSGAPRQRGEPQHEEAPPEPDVTPRTPQQEPQTPQEPPIEAEHPSARVVSTASLETVPGRRRPARYGLLVQFESRPGDLELARLVDSTIWINDAHPAFERAAASRSIGYHTALAVALALAPLAVGTRNEHAFITQFLAHWGSTDASSRVTRRRSRRSA